jgi:geranylgeranyl diphosphate synthase, type II
VNAAASPFREELGRYAAVTRGAMERFLPDRGPEGYLYDLVRDYPLREGKGLRPALLLATCQAYGGSLAEALGCAVALELLHNAFLVHDDVEDGSSIRRGRPALHEIHGLGLAVNAGDALACLALQALQDVDELGVGLTRTLVGELLDVVRKTTEGQALDLGWRRHNVVDLRPEDYLWLVGRKTCWYSTVAPLRMGAIVGSRGRALLDELSRLGFLMGVVFQIRDDLLDVEGTDDPLGDIHEGKRTLMLIHLLGSLPELERVRLVDYLDRLDSKGAEEDGSWVLDLMRRYGSLDFAAEYANGIADAAHEAFDAAFAEVPRSEHVEFIRQMVDFVLARTW